jgi:hypothetical protein
MSLHAILWGVATFPEEALTFDDLLLKARQRLTQGGFFEEIGKQEQVEQEISKV